MEFLVVPAQLVCPAQMVVPAQLVAPVQSACPARLVVPVQSVVRAHPSFLTIIIRSILVIYIIMLKLKIINKTRDIQK